MDENELEKYDRTYTWDSRPPLVPNKQVILRYIAKRTREIIFNYNSNADRDRCEEDLAEVEKYAEAHDIPFNIEIFTACLDDKEDFSVVWDSSAAIC